MAGDPGEAASRWTPTEAEVLAALATYREGAFPMAVPEVAGRRPDFEWFFADPRAVLPLGALRVSRSLRRQIRSGRFAVTSDCAFDEVVHACQTVPRPPAPGSTASAGGDESWISDDYRALLGALHRRGHAHSVEAWLTADPEDGEGPNGRLVGGIYGVALGGIFCAESMFSLRATGGSNASKVCLAHLVAHLRRSDFRLLDAQILNPFTEQLGVQEVPLPVFHQLLLTERDRQCEWHAGEVASRTGDEVLATLEA